MVRGAAESTLRRRGCFLAVLVSRGMQEIVADLMRHRVATDFGGHAVARHYDAGRPPVKNSADRRSGGGIAQDLGLDLKGFVQAQAEKISKYRLGLDGQEAQPRERAWGEPATLPPQWLQYLFDNNSPNLRPGPCGWQDVSFLTDNLADNRDRNVL